MRWESLFEDLESQWHAQQAADEAGRALEQQRYLEAQTSLRDRLAALADAQRRAELECSLVDGSAVTLRLEAVGADWLVADRIGPGLGRQMVLPIAAIASLTSDAWFDEAHPAPSPDPSRPPGLQSRMGLAFVLRDLARRRVPVALATRGGLLAGLIDQVGQDHCAVALRSAGGEQPARAVRGDAVVPFAALLWVAVAEY